MKNINRKNMFETDKQNILDPKTMKGFNPGEICIDIEKIPYHTIKYYNTIKIEEIRHKLSDHEKTSSNISLVSPYSDCYARYIINIINSYGWRWHTPRYATNVYLYSALIKDANTKEFLVKAYLEQFIFWYQEYFKYRTDIFINLPLYINVLRVFVYGEAAKKEFIG